MSLFRSRYKQPFYTSNDGKQERFPVFFFALYQHEQERNSVAEEWRVLNKGRARSGDKPLSVRTHKRHIRVDTLVLDVYVLIVRTEAGSP